MTHEVTHVASRLATGKSSPSWLVEGFADYVGLLRVQVPVTVSAGVLAAAVRTGGVPSELPTDAAFGPRAVALESAYEQAWWACQLFARTYGQPALVRLYRTVGAGTGVDAAVRQVTGASLAAFRAAWRASIAAELG
jgi:hypothetical protein